MKKHFLSLSILFCFVIEFSTIEAQKCGQGKSEFRGTIFGGENTTKGEFPWSVAFVHRKEENFFCGGSLISAKHVLSAAHCFQNKNIPFALNPFLVEAQIGKFNLSIENEPGSETLLVWEIVIHPDWKYDHHKFDADLSVVVLERKVTINFFIQPICLPKQSDDYVTGTGTVVGYGKSETSGGTSAIVPSKLELPAIDPAVCYTTHSKLARYSSTRMFCGGFDNLGKAPCLGDSGGGFYLRNKDYFWEIRGIVSGSLVAADHGCDINKFSLFTHVAKFADWIEEKIIETITVNWKFAEFKCVHYIFFPKWTYCSTTFKGPMTRNLKIHADFSSHLYKNSPVHAAFLEIVFFSSAHILSGIGEEFPNLRELRILGKSKSIKFIERRNFANMARLFALRIERTSINFLPEDLLADLPNLTYLGIMLCPQLERLPGKLFMNQRKLRSLDLSANDLTILQKELFKNNLKLETLLLNENKLIEIYVDFTSLPAIKWINLKYNKCIYQEWISKNGTIQSLQNKINRNCQPARAIQPGRSVWKTFVWWLT